MVIVDIRTVILAIIVITTIILAIVYLGPAKAEVQAVESS